jgi:dihydrolipoamide dehydrogenase
MGESNYETEVLVIGAGPGGYSAAFRAADLGMEVTLVDMEKRPGERHFVIPSKRFLLVEFVRRPTLGRWA